MFSSAFCPVKKAGAQKYLLVLNFCGQLQTLMAKLKLLSCHIVKLYLDVYSHFANKYSTFFS